MTKPDQHDPHVRMIHPPQPIPVFGCQVIVTPAAADGVWRGRAANYQGVEVSGDSERTVLQQFVKRFKAFASEKLEQGAAPQEVTPPETPQPGEQLRWIAVHL